MMLSCIKLQLDFFRNNKEEMGKGNRGNKKRIKRCKITLYSRFHKICLTVISTIHA